jgi:hypothetical protein
LWISRAFYNETSQYTRVGYIQYTDIGYIQYTRIGYIQYTSVVLIPVRNAIHLILEHYNMKPLFASLLFFLFIISTSIFAQSAPFPGLTKIKVATFSTIYVYYDSKLCKLINKPSKSDTDFVDVLHTSLIPSNSSRHLIQFCEGPSGDPWFRILLQCCPNV